MQITQEEIKQWLEIASILCVLIGHIVAITGTPKWLPSWVLLLINFIAMNYNKSKNADKKDGQ